MPRLHQARKDDYSDFYITLSEIKHFIKYSMDPIIGTGIHMKRIQTDVRESRRKTRS